MSKSAPNVSTDASTDRSTAALSEVLEAEGFPHHGFAELTRPVSFEIYEEWLKKGYQGEMQYLERHAPQKMEPQKLMSRARSAIVVTLDYSEPPAPFLKWPMKGGVKVARYAQGFDYHFVLKERLNRVIAKLQELYPKDNFMSFTDSSPVLERDLSVRAGLGLWVGKNTCVLSRTHGSLFFLAEIYTTLELPTARLEMKDFCGTCTRCIDACPTGALVNPRELDARKCISYLTIEARTLPAEPLRSSMQDWLFGCDICQTVCPWNLKVHGPEKLTAFQSMANDRKHLIEDLEFLLTTSKRGLERAFLGTPLARAGGVGLKRNALVVAANRKVIETKPWVEALVQDAKLSELARWALRALAE